MSLKNTHVGTKKITAALQKNNSIFFIGIGGVSMSCLAEICLEKGLYVAGSDRTMSSITDRMKKKGIVVFEGHAASHILNYGMVVYTLAIDADNEEYVAAAKNGILCVSRAEFLGYLMCDYQQRIGVSGMHGKSTTTAMLASVFENTSIDPTVVSGAALSRTEGCYRPGKKDLFIYEACEYMDSFLCFFPTVSIFLNIELDHTDYFKDLDSVIRSFSTALARLSPMDTAILNIDDENIRQLFDKINHCRTMTFGLSPDANIRATEITHQRGKFSFSVCHNGIRLGRIRLNVYGKHHIYNALAAVSAGLVFGIDFHIICQGIEQFTGARRRMEYHTTVNGIDIYEDYAHHPTEIAASLLTAHEMTDGEVWCIFQSHTYSRTYELFDQFTKSLSIADHVLVLPIYAARETDTKGISGEKLANSVTCDSKFVPSFHDAAQYILKHIKPGDMAIIMGAGDVYHVLDELGISSN